MPLESSVIHVTAGLKKGIGLEVFLKSYLCLNSSSQKKFILYTQKSSLNETCALINISPDSLTLDIVYTAENESQTLSAINLALKVIQPSDILLTLPSSKEEFILNNKIYSGHTEYFRETYHNSNLVMSFISKDLNMLLLTDHIELKNVGDLISEDLIISKVSTFLNSFKNIRLIHRIFFSGINPHCGENGLMGTDDKKIVSALSKLKKIEKFKSIYINGPYAGDTLFFKENMKNDLFVYAYHDQGLAVFKQNNGLQGINLTLGMPFIRVSPDHGTAPDLYGKNQANYLGMNYLLNEILKW